MKISRVFFEAYNLCKLVFSESKTVPNQGSVTVLVDVNPLRLSGKMQVYDVIFQVLRLIFFTFLPIDVNVGVELETIRTVRAL